jgi:hypothetical protein
MRQYTVIDGDKETVYNGIDRNFCTPIVCTDFIGIVRFEGECEAWRLDSREASREVVRYYADQGFYGARCMIMEVSGFHSDPAVSEQEANQVFN